MPASATLSSVRALARAAKALSAGLSRMEFAQPVAFVYNPLVYACKPYQIYIEKFGAAPKKVLFLGMNPGPWGMAQTGIPFGEVKAVREWLGIKASVGRPPKQHPSRPVDGFACERSEPSGRRLWGLFKDRFESADIFFKDHFVANYCPLIFFEKDGANLTPDKLRNREKQTLFQACDAHLRAVVDVLEPKRVVGVGAFAEERAREALRGTDVTISRILHPSPSNPAANENWGGKAVAMLQKDGIW